MTKSTLTATTALALTLGLAGTAAAQSAIGTEGDRIALTGTVESLDSDSFVINYGDNSIEVEFDGLFTTVDVEENLAQGDEVTVYGTVDSDWFEGRVIDAESVYVNADQTYYSGDMASNSAIYFVQPAGQTASVDGTYVILEGTVRSIDGREFTLASGGADISVDTVSMDENILDSRGDRRIREGDRVAVAGQLDDSLFDEMELSASTITTLRNSGSNGSMGGMASADGSSSSNSRTASADRGAASTAAGAGSSQMQTADMGMDNEPVDATYDPERADQDTELNVDNTGESEYAQTMDSDSPAVDNDANDMGETTVASAPVADQTDNPDEMDMASNDDLGTDRPQPSSGSDVNAEADLDSMEPEMAEAGQSDTQVYASGEDDEMDNDGQMNSQTTASSSSSSSASSSNTQRTASNTPERVDQNTSAEDLNRMTMNDSQGENQDAAPTELSLSNSTDMDAGTTIDPSDDEETSTGTQMASSGSASPSTSQDASSGEAASGMEEDSQTRMAETDTDSETDSQDRNMTQTASADDASSSDNASNDGGIATDTSQDEFAAMDEDGNGVLSREEFIAYVADPDNITREEAGRLFQVTARDDDELTREEFLTPSEEIDRVASEIVQ